MVSEVGSKGLQAGTSMRRLSATSGLRAVDTFRLF
jgi:hypothetical protein